MRIDNTTIAIYGTQPVMKTAKSARTQETTPASDTQSPFSVQLNNMVEKLSGVQPSNGEVRADKVQNISRQLANGNYNISGKDVAAKMLLALTS